MSWTTPLARPLKPRDHAELRTLDDARTYMLGLPEGIGTRQAWQQAAALLLAAAEHPTKAAIGDATRQVELAMFTSALTDLPADEALKREKGPPPA
jgi:hypothetical protein